MSRANKTPASPQRVRKRLLVAGAVVGLSAMTLLVMVAAYFFVASLLLPFSAETAVPHASPSANELADVAANPSSPSTAVATAVPLTPTAQRTQMAAANAAATDSGAHSRLAPPSQPTISELSELVQATPAPFIVFGELLIPAIDVDAPITPILIRDAAWDISGLGGQIGHLETTGVHPGDALAMAFTGHVTLPWPEIRGPFADLIFLKQGEEIVYRWQGNDYVYQVERIFRAHPNDVDLLYVSDGDKLVLVTCSGWDFVERTYAERLVTHATLVRVEPSPPTLEQ